MARTIPPEIRALFTAAELAEIARHPVLMGETNTSDAIDLSQSWALHVDKIDADRVLPWSDRTVWTEHDLAAALFIRGFLQEALDQLSPSVKARMEHYIATTDDHFRSYTVDDPAGKMAKIAEVDLAGRPWWWHRVPVSGPIVEDLTRW